jgi:hypothetical protein
MLMLLAGLAVSLVWFVCGLQSRDVISKLTRLYQREFLEDDPIEETVRSALWPHGWRSPTDLLGWEMPVIFVACWVILLW